MSVRRLSARWVTPLGTLSLEEPALASLSLVSHHLAGFYNEPHNAALLSNTLLFTAEDVVELWRDAAIDGSRSFLLRCDGALVGDCDFRNFGRGAAEIALLIGPRERQGRGLGARFASMLLAVGFGELGLSRAYVAIRPANAASLRLFARAGFTRDDGPAARSYAEEDDDVCMGLGRDDFFARHADVLGEIEITSEPQ